MSVADKVVLVTGATAGIGLATAAELARRGARVLVHGRAPAKTQAAVAAIQRDTGRDNLVPISGDLGSRSQVYHLAAQVLGADRRLDVLVNNAGVFMRRRVVTSDGLETTFQVNHLAYFMLADYLLDRLRESAPARIINVSSNTHRSADLEFDNLQGERAYDGYSAYARSKLCNVLFTHALARRLAGSGVTVNALHPGVINTNLLRAGWGGGGANLAAGARTSVYLADADEVAETTGGYFVNERPAAPAKLSLEEGLQERLWEVSLSLAFPA